VKQGGQDTAANKERAASLRSAIITKALRKFATEPGLAAMVRVTT
jgi:hypothetical protein